MFSFPNLLCTRVQSFIYTVPHCMRLKLAVLSLSLDFSSILWSWLVYLSQFMSCNYIWTGVHQIFLNCRDLKQYKKCLLIDEVPCSQTWANHPCFVQNETGFILYFCDKEMRFTTTAPSNSWFLGTMVVGTPFVRIAKLSQRHSSPCFLKVWHSGA